MKTHNIIKQPEKNCWTFLGIRNYFSWEVFFEYGEWRLYSIFGRHYKDYKSLSQLLYFIDYSYSNQKIKREVISDKILSLTATDSEAGRVVT